MRTVFYTNRFIPKGFAGFTRAFVIFIRPEHKCDKGLLEHEKVHVKQFWRYLCFNWALRLVSKKWEYKLEMEAFRVQLRYARDWDHSALKLSEFISTAYGFKVTKEQAYFDLTGKYYP
ncbi:MAG: hypothetical protein KAV87_68205 [Desulfobacteraceae bacterium]|nr:hypothetical protein [Desulfobacteraceae bacterium]